MAYEQIDPSRLRVFPLSERNSYLDIEAKHLSPEDPPPDPGPLGAKIADLAARIVAARERRASVMLAYGAHLIKNGCGPLVNALIERGFVTHLATQGAGIIHDWEFAFQGRSSESVRDNAPVGRFGSWDETGRFINLAVIAGAADGIGFGEAIGRLIAEDGLTLPEPDALARQIRERPDDPATAAKADLLSTMKRFQLPAGRLTVSHPFKKYSVPAFAFQKRVPFTVHPGIGYDIIVNHPMYHGAGRANLRAQRPRSHGRRLSLHRLGDHEPASVREGVQRRQQPARPAGEAVHPRTYDRHRRHPGRRRMELE